jgi:hypothetical protein
MYGGGGKGGEMTQILYAHMNKRKKKIKKLGAVTHVCNPSYSESRDWEDHSLSPDLAKSQQGPIPTHIKLVMAMCACHLRYVGRIHKRILVQANPGHK